MNIFPDENSGDDEIDENYPFDLGVVPITFDDTVVVHIFSSIDIPEVERINLTLSALLQGIGFKQQTRIDRIINEVGIKRIQPGDFTRDDNTRGPYYGYDQLVSKLAGMGAAQEYIEEIDTVESDETDDDENNVYFVHLSH